ncbi:hypothetical protein K438DRAFT_1839272 [Mycena galopus ATCC 62051]|nr:hypothetical protein K438DRAFT_1839272 [Mycena galopus ATCC 62051]
MVMSFFNMLALVSLFSFFVLDTLAQSSDDTVVTLWQFGTGRLLPGQATLPLLPLETASDGSATMYLYQVLNPSTVTTVVDATFTTQTIAATKNSGAPETVTVRVAVATQTPHPTSPPESIATSVEHAPSMGPIVGGAVAGSLVLLLVLALIILFLRRRRRQLEEIEKTVAVRRYETTAQQHPPSRRKHSHSRVPLYSHSTSHSVSLVVRNDDPPAYSGRTLSPTVQ